MRRSQKIQTPSSGPLGWLNCTRQNQSSTEKYLTQVCGDDVRLKEKSYFGCAEHFPGLIHRTYWGICMPPELFFKSFI